MRLKDETKPFPDALLAEYTPALLENPKWAANERAVVDGHNAAVADFASRRAFARWRQPEVIILSLAKAVDEWTRTENGQDGFGVPQCSVPMIEAFRAALNFNCGRLDCGTLDAWALSLFERVGVDENGEWL